MIILIIYLIFAVINIIIGSIITYIDYSEGEPITLGIIGTILASAILSIFGTVWFIASILDKYSDVVILQKKKVNND